MAAFRIRLLPEDRAVELRLSRGNWYELEDGSRLPVATRPAWCAHCQRFVEAEYLPPLETACVPAVSERRRHWREHRHSPSHCLDCGSTQLTLLSLREELPSPCHSGTIRVELGEITPPIPCNRIYTPEGALKAAR